MSKMVKIAVDAMGGDEAPKSVVEASVNAVIADPDLFLYLVGDEKQIRENIQVPDYPKDRLEIVHAPEVITNDEHPAFAIKKKKNSSIVVALRLVREGKAQAFVSAGSTGAILVGGQVLIGRIRGIQRPALAPIIPTLGGYVLMLDCGANVDAKPAQLVQYAQMGTIYLREFVGVKDPRVAILNVGTEENKGNLLVRETYPLLKQCRGINFTGSIESRDIPRGDADIVVTDAFAGNVALKMYEGAAETIYTLLKQCFMKNLKTKIGAGLVYGELKNMKKKFSMDSYGGAPMLGLKGLVMKAHGNSKPHVFQRAIEQAAQFVRKGITEQIAEEVGHHIAEEETKASGSEEA